MSGSRRAAEHRRSREQEPQRGAAHQASAVFKSTGSSRKPRRGRKKRVLFPLSVGSSQVCPTCTCHSSRDSRLPVSVLESRILKRSFPHYTLLVLPSSLSSPSHLNSSPLLSFSFSFSAHLISSHLSSCPASCLLFISSHHAWLPHLISCAVVARVRFAISSFSLTTSNHIQLEAVII